MFSLGNKEAIVNSSATYPVSYDSANDMLTIRGFGRFQDSQLVSATAQRFQASRNEAMTITAPTATELGITSGVNTPVSFSIRIKTFRDRADWATDYILNSKPIIFEISVSAGDSSDAVGTKMVSAMTEWESKFNHSDSGLPFVGVNNTGAVTLTMKDYSLLFKNRVEFKVENNNSPIVATTTKVVDAGVTQNGAVAGLVVPLDSANHAIVVGDTVSPDGGVTTTLVTAVSASAPSITVESVTNFDDTDTISLLTTALDPTYDGKYLEENVRMSLSTTSDSYGISSDEKPILTGSYTAISFVVNDAITGGVDGLYKKHSFLGATRGEVGGTRQFKYTLYLLEGTSLFNTGGAVDDIIEFIVQSPLSNEVLKIANGTTVTTAADFIA